MPITRSRMNSVMFDSPFFRLARAPLFTPICHSSTLRLNIPSRTFVQSLRTFPNSLLPVSNKRIQCGWPPRISFHSQIRHYARRRPNKPIITSFPQFTPRPLTPITRNRVFWGGIGFLGLLIFSPIPGWILLGGIFYGFYRLFRHLKRTQDMIFGPQTGILNTSGDGSSILDSLFARDERTQEVAAKIQEMAMERVEMAIQVNEEGIRNLFPTTNDEMNGEFHFSFPTEVSMVNASSGVNGNADMTFEVQIKFMVYLAAENGRKGAEIVAKADVIDDGVQLTRIDIREVKGGRRVTLQGMIDVGDDGQRIDPSGVGKGEGEGKVIDATEWTSKEQPK